MMVHEFLKSHREQKRLSLHSVHKETRISMAYLEALESGHWNLFPAEVYLLGFLRKYSSYLGLNPEEIIGLYKKELMTIQANEIERLKHESQIKKQEESKYRLKSLFLVAFVALFAFWLIFSLTREPAREKRKLDVIPKRKVNSSSLVESESLNLNVQALETVWIRIVGDKVLLFEGFLTVGSNRVWTSENECLLRIGNVNSVRLLLNGLELDAKFGAQKDVNELLLTRQSLYDGSLLLPQNSNKSTASVNSPATASKKD